MEGVTKRTEKNPRTHLKKNLNKSLPIGFATPFSLLPQRPKTRCFSCYPNEASELADDMLQSRLPKKPPAGSSAPAGLMTR
jgi:hypothetical protein